MNTHEDALNLILSDTCPSDVRPDGVIEFILDGCCATFTVLAKLTSTVGKIQYEIMSVEVS